MCALVANYLLRMYICDSARARAAAPKLDEAQWQTCCCIWNWRTYRHWLCHTCVGVVRNAPRNIIKSVIAWMLYCKLHPANVAMLRVNGGLRLLLLLCCFLLSIAFGNGSTLASTYVGYYFKDKREDSCSWQIQTCSNMTLGNKVFNLTFSIFETWKRWKHVFEVSHTEPSR